MVRISPINGVTYNLDKLDIDKVIAPPYDVISENEQDELYNSSQYNIVRLILGKELPDKDKYKQAAEDYKNWLDQEILLESEKPCIYYYVQHYNTAKGNFVARKGFIAKNYLEEFSEGRILPHEYTMGGPKEDRFKLMKECKSNFSQIFMIYSDPEKEIDKAFDLSEKPFIDVTDTQGVRNIVYKIDNKEVINKVLKLMMDKTLLIADGHHRYETALMYRDYVRSIKPDYNENDESNWVMAYYTNMDDDGLKVYPTHRIITKKVDTKSLMENLDEYFTKTEYPFEIHNKDVVKDKFIAQIEELSAKNIVFGLLIKNQKKYLIYELKSQDKMNKILEDKQLPKVLRKLDLSVLHKVIISDYLEISEDDQLKQNGIKYIKKDEEAFVAIESGLAEVVFIMATPKIQDIKEVSQEGYRMPQKSTYFYPKLVSGLVINPLE